MSEVTDDILLGEPEPWYSDAEKAAYERLAEAPVAPAELEQVRDPLDSMLWSLAEAAWNLEPGKRQYAIRLYVEQAKPAFVAYLDQLSKERVIVELDELSGELEYTEDIDKVLLRAEAIRADLDKKGGQ